MHGENKEEKLDYRATQRELKRLLLSRDGRDKSSHCCSSERLWHSLAAVALLDLPRPLPW